MTNIIGDIAGQYKSLIALTKQMPEGEIISVGDLVDRGPDSNRVIEYFMQPGRRAILGNHEHLMLDYLLNGNFYPEGCWFNNGGSATIAAYPNGIVPQEHIDWLKALPKYIEIDNCLISHAFLTPATELKEQCDFGESIWDKDETTIIWNRREPVQRDDYRLQICGHNSQFGLREWGKEYGTYAICLDDSRKKRLTGLHLETMTVYQQSYIY